MPFRFIVSNPLMTRFELYKGTISPFNKRSKSPIAFSSLALRLNLYASISSSLDYNTLPSLVFAAAVQS